MPYLIGDKVKLIDPKFNPFKNSKTVYVVGEEVRETILVSDTLNGQPYAVHINHVAPVKD